MAVELLAALSQRDIILADKWHAQQHFLPTLS